MIIKLILGEIDNDLNFNYDANSEVFASCAATLNGNMYVLGGKFKKKQVCFNKFSFFYENYSR